jgi:hypothetical protein
MPNTPSTQEPALERGEVALVRVEGVPEQAGPAVPEMAVAQAVARAVERVVE